MQDDQSKFAYGPSAGDRTPMPAESLVKLVPRRPASQSNYREDPDGGSQDN
jgi:hypothetical protein